MKNNSSIFLLVLNICLVISYYVHQKNDSLDNRLKNYYTQSRLFNKYSDSVMHYGKKCMDSRKNGNNMSANYYEGKAMAFWSVSKFAYDSSMRVK